MDQQLKLKPGGLESHSMFPSIAMPNRQYMALGFNTSLCLQFSWTS